MAPSVTLNPGSFMTPQPSVLGACSGCGSPSLSSQLSKQNSVEEVPSVRT
jgi:hypothetical protein